MYELTNEQRNCFALKPVEEHWDRTEVRQSPHDSFRTILYFCEDTVVKCVLSADSLYREYELCEKVTSDRKYLLPKTAKGKPVSLSTASIQKRKGTGMHLYYSERNVHLYNDRTDCTYYANTYEDVKITDFQGFAEWVEIWCRETTAEDLADIHCFSQQARKHIRYRDGDVFRFRIGRKQYGYGRILLDYDRMRKKKEPFWDILMGKPLVCSVYHIITERNDLRVEDLCCLASLPSAILADNALYYGEYKIIGNIPVSEQEDYPIMYGSSISPGEKAVCFQCGKTYRKLEGHSALYPGFRNNGVCFSLNFTYDVLLACIREGANDRYWTGYYTHFVEQDLRNPKFQEKRKRVIRQFQNAESV